MYELAKDLDDPAVTHEVADHDFVPAPDGSAEDLAWIEWGENTPGDPALGIQSGHDSAPPSNPPDAQQVHTHLAPPPHSGAYPVHRIRGGAQDDSHHLSSFPPRSPMRAPGQPSTPYPQHQIYPQSQSRHHVAPAAAAPPLDPHDPPAMPAQAPGPTMGETMQFMMMNQMMMQQMSAQQMQQAQMAALTQQANGGKCQNGGCGGKRGGRAGSMVNVQTCHNDGKRGRSRPRPRRPPPPVLKPVAVAQRNPDLGNKDDFLDNWQEATIILCMAVVGLIYLVSSRMGGGEEKEEKKGR